MQSPYKAPFQNSLLRRPGVIRASPPVSFPEKNPAMLFILKVCSHADFSP